MKVIFLLACFCLLPVSGAPAQEDTAHHRKVYQKVNDSLGSLKKVQAVFAKGEPEECAIEGWTAGEQFQKIISQSKDDGAGVEEYYLEKGALLFVYNTYTDAAGKKVENRIYLKNGAIFKWIAPEGGPVLHAEDYEGEQERLNKNCKDFAALLKSAMKKTKEPDPKAKAPQSAEGTFTGIEEGDYAHWAMKTSTGKALSLFILKPDASVEKVIASPGKFVGRKCRVQWKSSMENIPEAGGKMKVDQILSVEWLGK